MYESQNLRRHYQDSRKEKEILGERERREGKQREKKREETDRKKGVREREREFTDGHQEILHAIPHYCIVSIERH